MKRLSAALEGGWIHRTKDGETIAVEPKGDVSPLPEEIIADLEAAGLIVDDEALAAPDSEEA